MIIIAFIMMSVVIIRMVMDNYVVIFDLDDTVLMNIKGHAYSMPTTFKGATAEDWSAWDSLLCMSTVIKKYRRVWWVLRMCGMHVCVMTARAERTKDVTMDVLRAHGMVPDSAYFRSACMEDAPSAVVKGLMVDHLVGMGMVPLLALDDSDANVELFATRGMRVIKAVA